MTLPKFIRSSEKKKIIVELEETYGIKKLPYLLLKTGKGKIRAFSGSLSKKEIVLLTAITNIETIGLYMINQRDINLRLNFDVAALLQDQITKNIIQINEQQFQQWLRGYDLDVQTKRGPMTLKFQNDIVGFGKSNTEKIFNYTPKERKLKTPLPRT